MYICKERIKNNEKYVIRCDICSYMKIDFLYDAKKILSRGIEECVIIIVYVHMVVIWHLYDNRTHPFNMSDQNEIVLC